MDVVTLYSRLEATLYRDMNDLLFGIEKEKDLKA